MTFGSGPTTVTRPNSSRDKHSMSKRLRTERKEQLVKERRRRRLLYGGVAVVVVVLLGALVYNRFIQTIPGLERLGPQDRGHAVNVDVATEPGLPPVGGVHSPNWLNCGVYREPVAPENAVHSLEHGAVWITYRPDLPADEVSTLEAYADNLTLVSPYPDLRTDVVVSAWGTRLLVDDLPDDRIDAFIARYKGQGPEPGATCTGGVGTPVG